MTVTFSSQIGDKGEVFEACKRIRFKVFVDEQGFEDEIDGNESRALHILASVNGEAAGTIRLVELGDKTKLTRLAVLKEYRNLKLGGALVKELVKEGSERGVDKIVCHSQLQVVGFYEKYGFRVCGDEFIEDGAPHLPLLLDL